jgi:hypothetical protein
MDRMERNGRDIDAKAEEIWTAPATLERIREYVARTLKKS